MQSLHDSCNNQDLDITEMTMPNREHDRIHFPDPEFNAWLDEPIANNELTVWHATQNVASAWSAWQARASYDYDSVVVTKDDTGQIVAVTRQDSEGLILSVIAESAPRTLLQDEHRGLFKAMSQMPHARLLAAEHAAEIERQRNAPGPIAPGTPAGPDRWHAAPAEQEDLFAGDRHSPGQWDPTRGPNMTPNRWGAWVPWYKAKQAVATAFVRHHTDLAELRDELDEMKRQVEYFHRVEDVLRHERDQARSSYDRVIKIFVGIYSFIQPAPFPSSDGKTYEFVPPPELLLETWRALSKRIRDLPEKLAEAP